MDTCCKLEPPAADDSSTLDSIEVVLVIRVCPSHENPPSNSDCTATAIFSLRVDIATNTSSKHHGHSSYCSVIGYANLLSPSKLPPI